MPRKYSGVAKRTKLTTSEHTYRHMLVIFATWSFTRRCSFYGYMLLQDGNTSLHLASRKRHAELCELLLGAKVDVEAKDMVREAKPLIDDT